MRSTRTRKRPRATSTSCSPLPLPARWPERRPTDGLSRTLQRRTTAHLERARQSSATMAIALIVAAVRGERLGADRPKALVELAGRPMLQWSIDALARTEQIERIVVALPPGVPGPDGV